MAHEHAFTTAKKSLSERWRSKLQRDAWPGGCGLAQLALRDTPGRCPYLRMRLRELELRSRQ
jgi:hypothetical protein